MLWMEVERERLEGVEVVKDGVGESFLLVMRKSWPLSRIVSRKLPVSLNIEMLYIVDFRDKTTRSIL